MTRPDFTPEQWLFLATLEALGGSASMNVAGALAPLAPGPLFDLIVRARRGRLMKQTGPDTFRLAARLNPETAARINRLNQPARLAAILEELEKKNLLETLAPPAVSRLLRAAGRTYEAAVLAESAAGRALSAGDLKAALENFGQVLTLLESAAEDERTRTLYVSSAVTVSRLRFRLGQGMERVPELLKKARDKAAALGDRRSKALIGLHLGLFYYLNEALPDALAVMSAGLEEVRSLGDEDILARSSEFFGLYYYLQGRYREAAEYFERAVREAEERGDALAVWPVPAYLGYSTAVLGQLHRAIGLLDAYWRRARQREEPALAVHFRALLGLVLLMMDKRREASFHLQGARRENLADAGLFARLMCDLGLAYLDFKEGRIEPAHQRLMEIFDLMTRSGLALRQYPTPVVLELLSEFKRRGLKSLPYFDFDKEMERLLAGENVHLKGVALRLRALALGTPTESVQADLEASESCLEESGDPIELARTRVALARQALGRNLLDQARRLALKAWEGLSGAGPDNFPDDLRFLVEHRLNGERPRPIAEDLLERLFALIHQMAPSPDQDELLGRLVEALCRFFRAERGGLFWFSSGKKGGPLLRAGRNMSRGDVESHDFRDSLAHVFRAARANRPLWITSGRNQRVQTGRRSRSILCLPLKIEGRTAAVLYLDNSYLDLDLETGEDSLLIRLTDHVAAYFERVLKLGRLMEEHASLSSSRELMTATVEGAEIMTQSPVMMRLLALADRAAASESSVLITGETGVGKELLARRLHLKSPRRSAPFIVADLASTPEGLVESELFGHEKGAFTGADQRRPGRLELAHRGTLFLDELGEVPRTVQVKLLRVLQEKSFMRLGGARSISSDFRLVAATNRVLEEEVSSGRFRPDLYYRLNVVSLSVPPLRDRGADVILLAENFTRRFAGEFNRPLVKLTTEDEKTLLSYHWPGNVRELRNIIERAVLLGDGPRLALRLPETTTSPAADHPFADWPSLDEVQRRYILHVLGRTKGKVSGPDGAAEILEVKRTTLNARLKKLGLIPGRQRGFPADPV
ncbi:MAG: sigma 54-interacting transcriptional regulator [Thermodesulfobacteriota bacterium]